MLPGWRFRVSDAGCIWTQAWSFGTKTVMLGHKTGCHHGSKRYITAGCVCTAARQRACDLGCDERSHGSFRTVEWIATHKHPVELENPTQMKRGSSWSPSELRDWEWAAGLTRSRTVEGPKWTSESHWSSTFVEPTTVQIKGIWINAGCSMDAKQN